MRLPLLVFLILPVIELYLLFTLAAEIGGFGALMVVLGTAVVGFAVMRRQGFNNMMRMRQNIEQGQSPAADMFNGMLLGFAGFMLILPGLITDTLGIVLLIPWVRRQMARRLMGNGMGSTVFMGGFSRSYRGDIIDGEVVDGEQPRSGGPVFPRDERNDKAD